MTTDPQDCHSGPDALRSDPLHEASESERLAAAPDLTQTVWHMSWQRLMRRFPHESGGQLRARFTAMHHGEAVAQRPAQALQKPQ